MGGLCPKTALPIRAPWGETAPQYEGTVALDEYPFGKRLIPYFVRQPGFPGLSAVRKRASPCPAVAPHVALPRQGWHPFRPLRASLVNPCRGRPASQRVHYMVEIHVQRKAPAL